MKNKNEENQRRTNEDSTIGSCPSLCNRLRLRLSRKSRVPAFRCSQVESTMANIPSRPLLSVQVVRYSTCTSKRRVIYIKISTERTNYSKTRLTTHNGIRNLIVSKAPKTRMCRSKFFTLSVLTAVAVLVLVLGMMRVEVESLGEKVGCRCRPARTNNRTHARTNTNITVPLLPLLVEVILVRDSQ